MSIAEKYDHEGIPVEIHYDEEGGEYADPRQGDNLTTMVCWHPDYVLGDEQFCNPDGRGALDRDRHGAVRNYAGEFRSMEHLRRYIGIMRQGVCILPLSIYDHSGISMYVGGRHDFPFDTAGWDTTHVGFIYTTHERITELCGEGEEYHSGEWIEKQVRQDVETYNLYLTGQVYGYVVAPGAEDAESCWGFLGDEGVKEEANAVAASIAEARREARAHPWLPTFGNPIRKAMTA